MKRSGLRLFLCSAYLTALLAFIWGNSLLPGQQSGELSGFVGDLIKKLLPFLHLDGMHLLRKAAHFTEFAALGLGFAWLFGMLCKNRLPALGLPLVCGASVAAIDETIQIFSPDRGPSITDVGIDTAGVITGILFLKLIYSCAHSYFRKIKK